MGVERRSAFRVLRDVIALVKKGGERHENIQADFRADGVLVPVRNLPVPIEPGDKIERQAAFDTVERYEVLDPGYEPGKHNEPAYRAKVRSEADVERDRSQAISHIYQYGANARVNIGSEDRSVNTVYGNTNTLFSELRQAIQESSQDAEAKSELLQKVEELEEAKSQPDFLGKLADFTKAAQNATTVIQPFLPALIEWGSKLAG